MFSRGSNKNVQALGVIMKKSQGCTKIYLGTLREERNHCFKVKQDLAVANVELTLRALERDATTSFKYYKN